MILAIITGAITQEQYDKVREDINLEANTPKGFRFHVSSFDAKGCHIVDLWNSEAELNEFMQKRISPSFAKAGFTGQPKIEIFPIHSLFVPTKNVAELSSENISPSMGH